MKKLLTLAIGLIMANISVNAQNCNFTYQQDPSTGTYYFAAPFFSDTNNTIYTWSFENGNAYGFGPYATHNYSQSMTDHAVNVWGTYVLKSGFEKVYIVAHSLGSSHLLRCVSYFLKW